MNNLGLAAYQLVLGSRFSRAQWEGECKVARDSSIENFLISAFLWKAPTSLLSNSTALFHKGSDLTVTALHLAFQCK